MHTVMAVLSMSDRSTHLKNIGDCWLFGNSFIPVQLEINSGQNLSSYTLCAYKRAHESVVEALRWGWNRCERLHNGLRNVFLILIERFFWIWKEESNGSRKCWPSKPYDWPLREQIRFLAGSRKGKINSPKPSVSRSYERISWVFCVSWTDKTFIVDFAFTQMCFPSLYLNTAYVYDWIEKHTKIISPSTSRSILEVERRKTLLLLYSRLICWQCI